MKTEDAIARAMDVGQDLIEVSPNAKPPVAKILNYGKLKYEEKKKAQASKKKQHVVKIKELRVRPRIDDHDLMTKVNRGRQFISDGCKLKITLMYRAYNRFIFRYRCCGKTWRIGRSSSDDYFDW